jgi:hypothetical protein
MWTAGETPIGGVVGFTEEMKGIPSHWLGYVTVKDVDKSAKQATELGGKVLHEPSDIPTVGRYAIIADPQGAVLSIFKPGPDSPPPQPFNPKPLEFSWHELATTDYKKAIGFYEKMFDWETVSENDMGEFGVYLIFGQGGVQYGGMFNKPPQMPVSAWCYYVRVSDVNKSAEKIEQNGGAVINGPMEVPGGDWIAQGLDPQGAMFAVHQKGG